MTLQSLQAWAIVGHQTLTVSSAALAFTLPTGNVNVQRVRVTVRTDVIRWRADGTNPTSSTGETAGPGELVRSFIIDGDDISDFRAIRQSTDAEINMVYEERRGGS